jgi:DNA-binding GntR family transcriptional regulator
VQLNDQFGSGPARAGGRVYSVLKDRLLDGVYRGGDRLRVEDLSSELGVSKQPVMETLRRLSAEQLVVITPQVGCRVIEYDLDEIFDFFQMMAAVDGTATAMAATRRTSDDLRRLELISAQIGALVDEPSSDIRARGYRVMNREFHGLIHAMSGTEVVRWLGGSLMDRSDFYINSSTDISPLGSALAERQADHEAILAGIADRDAAAARAASERHMVTTVDLIKQALREDLRRNGEARS